MVYPDWRQHKVFGRIPLKRWYAGVTAFFMLMGVISVGYSVLAAVLLGRVWYSPYLFLGVCCGLEILVLVVMMLYDQRVKALYKKAAQVLDVMDGRKEMCHCGKYMYQVAFSPIESWQAKWRCECGTDRYIGRMHLRK